MDLETRSDQSQYASLETISRDDGFADFKWIAPEQIVVAQWVRMKCMFGCSNHGRKGACPPQTLAVSDCERVSENMVMLLFGGCNLCQECTGERSLCILREKARPAPEGLAVDVFSMVEKSGYPISVLTDPAQAADRYVLLMVE